MSATAKASATLITSTYDVQPRNRVGSADAIAIIGEFGLAQLEQIDISREQFNAPWFFRKALAAQLSWS